MAYDLQKEKREAIEAGEYALQCLYAAADYLDSARNWGFLDLFGGGLISSLAKRSKMEKAKQCMEDARYALRDFSRELKDVSIAWDLDIVTDDFLSFADLFFDGFFVDWMVQDRINRAAEQVEQAVYRVEEVLDQLRRI
ncbi:MAG: hypothetical protein Q4B03_08995 [Lachnospiraceae bacterium]|nr:hypothetical protein [Lachnospiraceae bacterium]